MDMDIDMDIDLDLGVDDRMEAETEQPREPQHNNAPFNSNAMLPEDPLAEEPGNPVLDKVHIRGLDNISSSEVKQWAGEHYSLEQFERIEWIDDTSANLIYGTAQAASEALLALTNEDSMAVSLQNISPLQLRPAKGSLAKPDIQLFLRQGSSIDVKKKGAHQVSRYYLLNPDQDPWERRRQQDTRRPRGRRGSEGNGEYNRRQYDDREHKRRRDDHGNGFDASMYDDGEADSRDNSKDDRRKKARLRNRDDDLFAERLGRADGRLRRRSASPLRDGDGKLGFGNDSDDPGRYKRSRQRSRSPNRLPYNRNGGKELFASTSQQPQKELFPDKTGATSMRSDTDLIRETAPRSPGLRSSMELFPNKRGSFSNHRRTGAFDASRSVTADLFSNSTPPPARERSLADRITGRPATAPGGDNIRVRGAADDGISIRGMGNHQGPPGRELFPLKAGGNNLGKELFGEKIKGRGGPRRKAEDMFL